MSLCEGLLTRIRKTDKVDEKAVLDFFLVNDRMKPFIIKMVIDEEKDHILTNLSQAKKNHRAVDSDHLSLQFYMNLQFSKLKPGRKVLFNITRNSGRFAPFFLVPAVGFWSLLGFCWGATKIISLF